MPGVEDVMKAYFWRCVMLVASMGFLVVAFWWPKAQQGWTYARAKGTGNRSIARKYLPYEGRLAFIDASQLYRLGDNVRDLNKSQEALSKENAIFRDHAGKAYKINKEAAGKISS